MTKTVFRYLTQNKIRTLIGWDGRGGKNNGFWLFGEELDSKRDLRGRRMVFGRVGKPHDKASAFDL